MRLAVCQFAPSRDVGANLDVMTSLVKSAAAADARVVVLQEAAMYACLSPAAELEEISEPLDGPFVSALSATAASADVVLVAGMYESNDRGRPYNTVVAVGPEGLRAFHRKYMVYDAFGYQESDTISVGVPRADVFMADGLKFGLLTCYEVRFPECARRLVDVGVEAVIMSSAWPLGQGKEDHFRTMIRARALENTIYVAVASDCSATMVGRSHVIDPLGYQLAGLANEEGFACADLEPERLVRARQTLPVLEQRRRLFLNSAADN